MGLVQHEPLATYEKWLLALLLFVVMVHVYFEMKAWHLLRKISRLVSVSSSIIKDFSNGKYYKPWGQSTPIVIVSTKKHIAELSEAACLSQRAVYADMFGFKHTMDKLEHNTSDHKVIRTRLYSRVLQVMGPDHLNSLYPHLLVRLNTDLDKLLRHGASSQDGISLPVAQTARQLASSMMSLMFFGEVLSSDAEFSDALLRYPRDMVRCMGAFQIVPPVLSPFIHDFITKGGKAMRIIQSRLLEHLETHHSTWVEPKNTKQLTILYNMADIARTSDYWNPSLLAQSLLGIWFAASHQPWMNLHFIILEMCVRKECQGAIRRELKQSVPLDYQRLEQLPLLDSFIKETVRFNPLDKLAIRRKALESYTFSDGSISVPAGATVCTSAYDQMHNPEVYPNPYSFDPTRYLSNDHMKKSRFTDVSESFPVWGYGSLACPGRIQASLVIKMVLSELLLNYDLSLENDKARTRWSWETFTMPYESTRVSLKRRTDSSCNWNRE
ncbi:putative cytochrome P450 [Xylaria grammica]|nr:putative cytochrome P450 [Xylaria grammica]